MWRNDLQHHLTRQPHQRAQNFCYQMLRPLCLRVNCNSQTIWIQRTTSYQLQQRNRRCLQTQTTPNGHVKQTTPSADESINDERASLTHKVATDFSGCNICLAGVQLEAM